MSFGRACFGATAGPNASGSDERLKILYFIRFSTGGAEMHFVRSKRVGRHSRIARRLASCSLCAIALLATPAISQGRQAEAGERDLGSLLVELSEKTSTELLFDQSIVKGRTARPAKDERSIEAMLVKLLAGTGIRFRRVPDGAYVLYDPLAPEAQPPGTLAVPEILVLGKRSQNVDIRRTPNDVQPYRVVTADQIAAAHRDNVDQLLRARLPGNGDYRLGDLIDQGQVRSSVDLRGVGTTRTLILVDGRRVPSPADGPGFRQADLNPVPLNAIERIETLTSTAGGIYGPGATGGVVNIVLRREYRGIDLFVTGGISDRGDTAKTRLEGRLGISTPDDRTQIMLFGSYEVSNPLKAAERDYVIRARQIAYANDPWNYLVSSINAGRTFSDSILVYSSSPSDPLVLKPQFGGTSLGSNHSYLPLGFLGTMQDRLNELHRNAGSVPSGLSPFAASREPSLLPPARRASAIFSARHKIGGNGAELFVDGLVHHSRGGSQNTIVMRGVIGPDAPGNPFATRIFVALPNPVALSSSIFEDTVGRITAGVIIPITEKWQASGDITLGRAISTRQTSYDREYGTVVTQGLLSGLPVEPDRPALRPLDDWQAFIDAIPAYLVRDGSSDRTPGRSFEASARLAGPVGSLSAGPATLALLAEARRERRVPSVSSGIAQAGFEVRDEAIYAELHAPLLPLDAAAAPLRGLQLQLAGRLNATTVRSFEDPARPEDRAETHSRLALSFTAGAHVRPWPFLTLRGSYATGSVAPAPRFFLMATRVFTDSTRDPRRGGQPIGQVTVLQGGRPRIEPEIADTLSLGFVIDMGPRLSLDYSRISIRKEVNQSMSIERLLVLESAYPDRVVRAPLADEDRAKGYTAGKITQLDRTAGNFGRSRVHSIDMNFDWKFADPWGGRIAPYAAMSWQPSLRTQVAPDLPWVQRIGFSDGPLEWRGNGGVVWTRGPTSVDLNVQYLSGYRVARAVTQAGDETPQIEAYQGGARISPQVYVDLAASRTFRLARRAAIRTLEARLGVLNIFDRSPEIIANPSGRAFSPYGDPRRRRIELVLAARY